MIVAEGATKPTTDLGFAQTLASIITIATVTRVSIQSLNDVPSLQTWIDQRLSHAVMLSAEDHFLNAAAPDGLLASAGTLSAAFTPGTGATTLDEIGAACSQLAAAGYTPDAAIMNGGDANKMRLLKDSQGRYLWASPDSGVGARTVWSVPLIISPAIAPGTWLVGAFAQSCILFVRQAMTIEFSFEDQDNFIRNLCTLRAEERCALAIAVPGGLLKGATVLATQAQPAKK
jgi:HK97 family phage major capsid protein